MGHKYTEGMTSNEISAYQALRARGISPEDAREAALDGVDVEGARDLGPGQQPDSEQEVVDEVVNPTMVEFAAQFQSAIGKMKAAHESQTNCLLQTREVEAVLGYVQAVGDSLRDLGLRA